MEKKNIKFLAGMGITFGVLFACGLGWDEYDRWQSRKEYERERAARAELVRNWSDDNYRDMPNLSTMKKALDQAGIALASDDVPGFKKAYFKYEMAHNRSIFNRETEEVREALSERMCELLGMYVEHCTPNWRSLSEKEKLNVRMDLVCELDSEFANAYLKGEIK